MTRCIKSKKRGTYANRPHWYARPLVLLYPPPIPVLLSSVTYSGVQKREQVTLCVYVERENQKSS